MQGKEEIIELAVLGLLTGSHLLIEDVPGVGKTTLAKALAAVTAGSFGRIQFTPDLLPSDVVGTNIWNQRDATFEFRTGPIFSNVLLADEINRASPKTQSALLESMAEHQVTTDRETRPLPRPFMVIATQNPLEHHGTYPLPESQLDRFAMRLSLGYPDPDAELRVLAQNGADHALANIRPITDSHELDRVTSFLDGTHIEEAVQRYLLNLIQATRTHQHVLLGLSPRAALSLQRLAKARAQAAGRQYVLPDDIKALLPFVAAHRVVLDPSARVSGLDVHSVLEEILHQVPVPVGK